MKKLTASVVAALALSLWFAPLARAEAITITTFGGAFENAVSKAFFEPFTAAEKTEIKKEQYDGGLAKLRAMVEAKTTSWDVLDLESNDAISGCDEGLLQKLDPKSLGDPNDFLPGAVLPCAVASMVWSTVFAYDTTKLKPAPTIIKDFFDLKAFPGKRGLRKNPKVVLEWALLADGVPAASIYKTLATPEGLDRAFSKLDTIKSSVVWWEAGSQPPQLLADGAVAMTQAYNGRIYDAQIKDHKPFKIVWDGQVYDYEWWGIPTGTKNSAIAAKFISFASRPEVISQLSKYIAYAPPRRSAIPKVSPDVLPEMPTAPDNFKNALQLDSNFWADNFDVINKRFLTWLSQ